MARTKVVNITLWSNMCMVVRAKPRLPEYSIVLQLSHGPMFLIATDDDDHVFDDDGII